MNEGRTINVVIPMAGRGQRFISQGITTPKPLIKLGDRTIIEWIVLTLGIPNARYIFIVRKEHVESHGIDRQLRAVVPNSEVIVIDRITEGATCTVLLAQDLINSDQEMVIKDCDQILSWSAPNFFEFARRHEAAGAAVTIPTQNPGFSYVKLDDDCMTVLETAEKRVISWFGCSGLYYFGKGREFIKYAIQMIAKNIRVNNEFYVSLVYNQYIEDGRRILNYPIAEMFSFNTPEELAKHQATTLGFLERLTAARRG
jgi:NDP-sugar pyrophosphorylase family protein